MKTSFIFSEERVKEVGRERSDIDKKKKKKRLVCYLPQGVWQHCLRAIEVPSILLIAFCGFPGSEVWPFKVKLPS